MQESAALNSGDRYGKSVYRRIIIEILNPTFIKAVKLHTLYVFYSKKTSTLNALIINDLNN